MPLPSAPAATAEKDCVRSGKAPPVSIVMVDRRFWTSVINLDAIVEAGMITRDELGVCDFADDAEEAWTRLVARDAGAQWR